MARVTPEQYAEKHARRLKAAGPDIRRGIENVTQAPGAAAVRQRDKMLRNLTESIESGRWATKTGAVTLDEWKAKAINKGLGRISAGIDAVQAEQVQMAGRLLAAVDSAKTAVDAMPDENLDDAINRMAAFARSMAAKKGTI